MCKKNISQLKAQKKKGKIEKKKKERKRKTKLPFCPLMNYKEKVLHESQ